MRSAIQTIFFLFLFSTCFTTYALTVSPLDKDIKKDVIFVSINEELPEQLNELSEFVFNTYLNNGESKIHIQVYAIDKSDIIIVDQFVALLHDLGVQDSIIKLSHKELKTASPYFAITISSVDDVGFTIG